MRAHSGVAHGQNTCLMNCPSIQDGCVQDNDSSLTPFQIYHSSSFQQLVLLLFEEVVRPPRRMKRKSLARN